MLPLLVSVWDIANYKGDISAELQRKKLWVSIKGSIFLALSSGLTAGLIGVPAAYFLARYKIKFNKIWVLLLTLPLVMPSYLSAYSYLAAFGKMGFYYELFGREFPIALKGSLTGAWISMTMVNFPFVFLLTYTALLNLPASLEESAMSLGSSRKQVFFTVILPNIKVPIASGILMVSLYSLSDFGTPAIMDYRTLTYDVYEYQYNINRSAIYAVLLIGLACIILATELLINRKSFFLQKDKACTPAPKQQATLKMNIAAISYFLLITIFSLVLPVGTILYWAGKGKDAFEINNRMTDALTGSMTVSICTALFALVFAIPFAWYSVRGKGKLALLSDKVSYMGYMVPGVVIALALITTFRSFGLIYGTLAMPVIGCAIRFLPQAVSAIKTTLVQVSPNLEEASLTLGNSTGQTLRKITGPLILPGALSAVALVFITTIKELPITLMLSPPGNKFLTQIIWNYKDDAEYSKIAIPALLLLIISSLSLFFILKQNKRIENEQ